MIKVNSEFDFEECCSYVHDVCYGVDPASHDASETSLLVGSDVRHDEGQVRDPVQRVHDQDLRRSAS